MHAGIMELHSAKDLPQVLTDIEEADSDKLLHLKLSIVVWI